MLFTPLEQLITVLFFNVNQLCICYSQPQNRHYLYFTQTYLWHTRSVGLFLDCIAPSSICKRGHKQREAGCPVMEQAWTQEMTHWSAMGKAMALRGTDRASIISIANQQLIMEVLGIVSFSFKWKQSLNFFVPSGPKSIMQAKPVSGTLADIMIARLLY